MAGETGDHGGSWSIQKKTSLVLRILRGEISIEEAALENGLETRELEQWRDQFLDSAEEQLISDDARWTSRTMESAEQFGVWVHSEEDDWLNTCLFLQAACESNFPKPASAIWAGGGRPPRPLARGGEIPVLHGVSRTVAGSSFSLFAAMLSAEALLERKTALSQWHLSIDVAGIVALVDTRRRPRALTWVKAQDLPFVIGAMSTDPDAFSLERFREDFEVPQGVSVVPGPAPMKPRNRDIEPGRSEPWLSIASILGAGSLRFDTDYALRLLARLRREL